MEQGDAVPLAASMTALGLGGVIFRPIYLRPYYMSKKGEELKGVQIHLTDPGKTALTGIQFHFLREAEKIDPYFHLFRDREERYRMFDQVCGTDRIRRAMIKDEDHEKAGKIWRGGTGE